ncbi:MAG TPA: type II toxin-antitoxin system RelE/ParE family toxin [Sulfuricurvum sp.]|nr:type II toxin-antitoxin system RelE/ParE family toxin [Sulfuricurvum sp.]
MASYKIEIKKSAAKEIENLPSIVLKRVVSHIQELGSNPRPIGCKKLSGDEKYRLRVGDYRILYEIEDAIVTVYVVKVAHRKEVYRML